MKYVIRVLVVLVCGFLVFYTAIPTGVKIPAGSANLELCEMREIRVENLWHQGYPGCDSATYSIVFPDEVVVGVPEIGVSRSYIIGLPGSNLGVEYSLNNWGVAGVSAVRINADGTREIWAATDEAYELEKKIIFLGDLKKFFIGTPRDK